MHKYSLRGTSSICILELSQVRKHHLQLCCHSNPQGLTYTPHQTFLDVCHWTPFSQFQHLSWIAWNKPIWSPLKLRLVFSLGTTLAHVSYLFVLEASTSPWTTSWTLNTYLNLEKLQKIILHSLGSPHMVEQVFSYYEKVNIGRHKSLQALVVE